jgi:hypothetical protein
VRVAPEIVLSDEERAELTGLVRSKLTSVRLAQRARIHVHFTPTSASWLNMVERFFRDITVERASRVFTRVVPELVTAIDDYIAHHNTNPKPFIWTKSARDIPQKVIRANSRLSSEQNAILRQPVGYRVTNIVSIHWT